MSTNRVSDLDFFGEIFEFEDLLAQTRLDHLTYPTLTAMEEDASLEVNDSAVVNGGIFDVHEVIDVEHEEDMTDPGTIYYYNGTHYYGDDGGEAIGFETVNGFAVLSDKNLFVTPEMFGAVGDGVTDDTSAFVTACQQGKPVYVKNSKIGTCSIEGVEVYAGNLILTGDLSIKDVDLHGSLTVNGGRIVVNRTDNVDVKEKSVLHDLKVNIVDCDRLLTVSGKQYNLKCYSWTVDGKCNDEVIKLTTPDWITYTTFENMSLGTSDRGILIDDTSSGHHGISDIHIKNVYGQRSGVTHSDCRFVETNSLGALYLDGSFMYDLAAGDSQVYINRQNTGSTKFNITYINTSLTVQGDSFAHDSNGASGLSLTADIANVPYNANGHELMPTPMKRDTPFYTNAANFYGAGHMAIETGANTAGIKMKIGSALKAKSPEKMIGVNYNDDTLTVLTRDADNQTWTSKTYISKEHFNYADTKAQIDAYGMGWPVFYTVTHSIVIRYGANYYDAAGNNITNQIT